MILFRLDASIRTEGSVTRQVADTALDAWRKAHPGSEIVRRDLAAGPVPAEAWGDAVSAMGVPPEEQTARQKEAVALASALADEVVAADAFLFAVPLYNYGVSQHFKSWVDLISTDPRLNVSGPKPLRGRPATLVTARGGGYGPGTPREGWDHATPWLVRYLRDVFELDLKVTEAELTLAEVTPAMAELRGLAKESLENAHRTADVHGRYLADRVGAA
ncbi:FMN-dependent NADH-azoreductase [Thermocatellispora tengchongensis]|uniref:FMN dependent NADH:quinone oxidoreductase n=1 Tax=Thermocatellispora tengchongensis TaxID=1073253 RepID=A0A840P6U6_9ACTN|nr:NAD(P)H-dependent oxidoreductase [Thermocatellispora tengchongensis]MBB5134729.1 FMN-dependent NADH-azoreductase [Thermocatellispora tengchongensis]